MVHTSLLRIRSMFDPPFQRSFHVASPNIYNVRHSCENTSGRKSKKVCTTRSCLTSPALAHGWHINHEKATDYQSCFSFFEIKICLVSFYWPIFSSPRLKIYWPNFETPFSCDSLIPQVLPMTAATAATSRRRLWRKVSRTWRAWCGDEFDMVKLAASLIKTSIPSYCHDCIF